MKVVAFVPIRLNSQRVEGKNLRLLGGEPLLCHILRTLLEVEAIDEVYVYCSDPAVRPYLPDGVRFLRRSPRLDRNETLGREIYDAFTAEVVADVYLLAHATSPFIRPATIAAALHKVTDEGYDSAFSAERMQTFAWYRGEPLNYALDAIPRTQEIEPVFVETSVLHLPPRNMVRPASAHRPAPLRRRRRPHRGDRHRLSRRFRAGRGDRKTAEQIIVAGRRSAKIRITFIADATHLRPVSP